MRRRVIELYEGRVVRDEVSGGYTEESTTEFGLRMRAEMGVGPEGQHQRPRHARQPLLMSRLFFFIQEAFRALRRNAAPSMAAIVTTGRHRDPARRPDPGLPDDPGEERRGPRPARTSRSPLYDDATKAEIDSLRQQAGSDPARRLGRLHHQGGGAGGARKQTSARTKARTDRRSSAPTRCRPTSRSSPTTPPTSTRIREAITPPGPNGKPQPISPIIEKVFDRQEAARRSSR